MLELGEFVSTICSAAFFTPVSDPRVSSEQLFTGCNLGERADSNDVGETEFGGDDVEFDIGMCVELLSLDRVDERCSASTEERIAKAIESDGRRAEMSRV